MKIIIDVNFCWKKCISTSVLLFVSLLPIIAQDSSNVRINNQLWMISNLDVEVFRNGDKIPYAKSINEWIKAGKEGKPAWCYYNTLSINGKKYGKLYNWFAINDSRVIAPIGWHIPTIQEWVKLVYAHDSTLSTCNKKMKAKTGWNKTGNPEIELYDGNGTNSLGFSAMPAGFRDENGLFHGIGQYCGFWSSESTSSDRAWNLNLNSSENAATLSSEYLKALGLSVRCIKD